MEKIAEVLLKNPSSGRLNHPIISGHNLSEYSAIVDFLTHLAATKAGSWAMS